MEPVKAINARIEELKAELSQLQEAKKLLSGKIVTSPSGEVHDIPEVAGKVVEFLESNPKSIGYTRKELARRLKIPYRSIVDAIRILERQRKVSVVDRNIKRGQRFVLKITEAKPDQQAHDRAAVDRVQKEMAKPSRKKKRQPRAIAKKGARLQQSREFLQKHEYFTWPQMANELNTTSSNIMQLFYQNDHMKKLIQNTGRKAADKRGRKNVSVWRSLAYQRSREAVIRPGEGVREGRRLNP